MKQKRTSKAKKPWNKGKQVGQKQPLKPTELRAIRAYLKSQPRELALFNLAIDSSLGAIDLLPLQVRDIAKAGHVLTQVRVMQNDNGQPIEFELTAPTRAALTSWITKAQLKPGDALFPSRLASSTHLSTRQYSRLVDSWVSAIGLKPELYGTHSLRRTRPMAIYQKHRDVRAIQVLLGQRKLESTTRFLGINTV